jgi:hypothetical protein
MRIAKGDLQGVEFSILSQPFYGSDCVSRHLRGEQHAGLHSFAVEMNRACSTDPLEGASDMGSGEPEMVAKEVNQQGPGRDTRLDGLSIDMYMDYDVARHYRTPFAL